MNKFVIPKGITFPFTIQVKQKQAYVPQSLVHMQSAVFKLYDYANSIVLTEVNLTIANATNGVLNGVFTPSNTTMLDVYTAPEADRSYVKSKYHATVVVLFTDGTPPVSVYIDQIYVVPGA